jgi:transcriptional regulator with XRE-family HTH domain
VKHNLSPENIFKNPEEAKCFARHLKQIRQEKNITQENLAFDCNVDRVTITRIESAKQNPTLDLLISLSKALNIPLKELFDF